MNQAGTVDLDRSIPVMVQREEAPPSGPPPQLGRTFILITAVAAAAAALLLLATLADKRLVAPVALAYLLVSVAALFCWRVPASWMARAITGLFIAVVAIMGYAALRLGWGLAAPALPLVPLLVCALTTVAGWRPGVLLALVSAAVVMLVAQLQPLVAPPPGWPSVGLLLGTHLVAIALGLASGMALGRVVGLAVQSAHKREQRFRRLLSLAADVYWEVDSEYRLVAAGQHDHELRALQAHTGLGALPWELPRFICDAETQDVLMADLETRAPFRDLPFAWRNRDGSQRSYLASGEPRFDAR
ncbi:MAG: hypothetical protein Q8R98_00730, partial [Rubrivivax sp.]|nr:hypothetical protein [Rubrivivax sp.]